MISRLVFPLLLILLIPFSSQGAATKAFVSDFRVVGEAKKEDLKTGLQAMLTSRLAGEGIIVANSAGEADVTIAGTYVAFGKVFSIDVAVKDKTGKNLDHFFEQGESADELIPAVTRLSAKVAKGLTTERAALPRGVETVQPRQSAQAQASDPKSAIIRTEDETKGGKFTRQLKGECIALARGQVTASGEREIYVADAETLTLYLQGEGLVKVAEAKFPRGGKLVSIDTADVDGNGSLEVYVTLVRSGSVDSQVWSRQGKNLVKVADGLPFFFRTISLGGGEAKLYGQTSGMSEDFEGDVREVVLAGKTYSLGKSVKTPRGAFLYNFNLLKTDAGETLFILLRTDGYLVVLNAAGEELWRSVDKFGGSAAHFTKEDLQNMRTTGAKERMVFIEQRLTVTPKGLVIVPINSGRFGVGNFRSYESNAIHALAWNGSSMDEKWRTRPSRRYLPDYFFDSEKNELVLLEVAKTSGLLSSGLSEVSVIKVD